MDNDIVGSIVLDEDCIFVNLECDDRERLLSKLAKSLERKGYVKESYCEAVIERERMFPTGLQTRVTGVAIPHADACHVNRTAVAVATLATPVNFFDMTQPERQLPVKLVIMLVIERSEHQVDGLQEIMKLLQNDVMLQELMASRTPLQVRKIISNPKTG